MIKTGFILKTVFIINPRSGTPKFVKGLHFLIRKYLGNKKKQVSIYESDYPGHPYEISAFAASEGCDLVVAVGGDGTINETARGLINTDTALGVLPFGSGNGYASNVGLPLRPDKALEIIKNPDFHRIDVGSYEDKIFLVSCGIGWEAIIATLFEDSRIRGILPYARITLSTFLQYEPQEIEIEAQPGNWQYRGRPMLFSIANMREWGVGVTIAPDASEYDGFLDICLLPRHDLATAVKHAPDLLFLKRATEIPGYISHKATELIIKREFHGNIHLDGTPFPAGNELSIKILPSALKVAVKPDI